MNSMTAVMLPVGVSLLAMLAQAQAPASDPKLRASMMEAIQQARALRKSQEVLSTALAAGKASPEMLAEQIAASEKSFRSLRESIEKIDEQYDSLSEVQQSAIREAWSIAKLFGVLFDFLKDSTAKPDSPERARDLLSNSTSTARRAVMLDETLSRLSTGSRTRR